MHGMITKPTDKKDEIILLEGDYHIIWRDCKKKKYYLITI